MSEPFIKINNLVKNYDTPAGSLNVLKDVNFEAKQGDFIAIVGPSGIGKTTLLNMLTGVDKPTEGMVQIGEVNVSNASERQLTKWRASNIGIVFQQFQLLPTLSVAENVMFPMDFTNTHPTPERREIAESILGQFGVQDQADKTPDMLSGGQQQRVAIARALATHPPLIVGDEPTANLDRMSATNVFDKFRELAIQGSTVIITTYDRELVKSVPIVYELDNGHLVQTSNQNH